MRSTMQDVPLAIRTILDYGSGVHGDADVLTYTGDGFRTASYRQLGARAAQLAHALRERLEVRGDQRVGTFLWNNQEHLEAYFAVPCMGAVLHTLNIRLPAEQLAYITDHAEDRVVLLDSSLIPVFEAVLPRLAGVRHVVVVGPGDTTPLAAAGGRAAVHRYDELLDGMPEHYDWPEVDERDAAALCYTSGTTDLPKGVAYSHRSVYLHSMQLCTAQGFGLRDADRVLPVVPMFHAMAWGLPYGALMSGASLVMPDRHLQPEPLAHIISTARPSYAAAVPTIWSGLLNWLDDPDNHANMSSLREVIIGGSALPPALLAGFEERHRVKCVHAWGMTETSPLGAVAHPPARARGAERLRYRLSQGRLPASVTGRLIGPDGDVLPADGACVGELEVRGPWVAASYYKNEAAADKFHDGWLRTGDIGMLSPDGYFTITDRAKDVIKSGGEWISSVDLENRLMAHADVAEATVVAVPDDRWGERPLAVVVWRTGRIGEFSALRDMLAAQVARWQVPERWTSLDVLPKTTVGKFDKKEVRRAYAAGELDVVLLERG
jgi:fatty-acyl-CoA synthase